MLIDSTAMVSVTELNQNFPQVAKLISHKKTVYVMKNNKPKYIIMEFPEAHTTAPKELVLNLADTVMDENDEAFKVLAK